MRECAGAEAEDDPRFEDLRDTHLDALLQQFYVAMSPASAAAQYGQSAYVECQIRNKSVSQSATIQQKNQLNQG